MHYAATPRPFQREVAQSFIWGHRRKEWVPWTLAQLGNMKNDTTYGTLEEAEQEAVLVAASQPERIGTLRIEEYMLPCRE